MPDESTIVEATLPELTDKPVAEADALVEEDEEEDFNPLGNIEGWSAFECSSGPFGHRG